MRRTTPAVAVAMGVGLGAALASSMGPAGWATGLAAVIILLLAGQGRDGVGR